LSKTLTGLILECIRNLLSWGFLDKGPDVAKSHGIGIIWIYVPSEGA